MDERLAASAMSPGCSTPRYGFDIDSSVSLSTSERRMRGRRAQKEGRYGSTCGVRYAFCRDSGSREDGGDETRRDAKTKTDDIGAY